MAAPLPPAGWYPDPSGAAGQRYFDGATWTASHAPPPPSIVINNVMGGYPPVLVKQGPNHALHLVLTVLTCGLWLPVWLIVTLAHSATGSARTWRIIGAIFGGLVLIGLAAEHPGSFVALAVLAGLAYLGYRAYERTQDRRLEAARIAARADAQNQALLSGDPSGLYGEYPPPQP